METLPQYRSALDLERTLGDPADSGRDFCFAGSAADDELEAFSERGVRALSDWGFQRYLVPIDSGGVLDSFDELALLVRLVARRDLTVAIATGQTFLGTMGVWLAGNEEQRRRAARVVLEGGAAALALSEREHGSDIVAGDVRATAAGDGFRLDGTKWLINNATRGRLLSVFARTREAGGLRGFSLLLVDKSHLEQDTFHCLPKIRTLGIRGADISGIRFEAASVGQEAVIRRQGAGLDLVLRVLCVTRTLCASFSLGAFDTALRTTLDFATNRRLYRRPMMDLRPVQRSLADALADLIACECVSIAATRALHVVPRQVSVSSAVAKYFVPTLTEDALRSLSATLGARYYLREEHVHGIFQKMLRDNAVVGLFDGSTAVNLTLLSQQLPRLMQDDRPQESEARERNRSTFRLAERLPAFDGGRLSLDSRGRSDVVDALGPGIAEEVRAAGGSEDLVTAAAEIVSWRADLVTRVALDAGRLGADFARTEAAFSLAHEYCALHTAAACVWTWLENRDEPRVSLDGDVVLLGVERLLERHGRPVAVREVSPDLLTRLLEMHRAGQLFSMLRLPLGGS